MRRKKNILQRLWKGKNILPTRLLEKKNSCWPEIAPPPPPQFKPRDQKQGTGNDCGVNSGLQASRKTDTTFSYFLISNALLYHFLANCLAHNKKMTEKSVFRQAWSPELTSQSFPVSCFWCRGFVPHRKWNLTLLAHQNTGKENCYRKFFFATLVSTLRRFNRANKKNLPYTL